MYFDLRKGYGARDAILSGGKRSRWATPGGSFLYIRVSRSSHHSSCVRRPMRSSYSSSPWAMNCSRASFAENLSGMATVRWNRGALPSSMLQCTRYPFGASSSRTLCWALLRANSCARTTAREAHSRTVSGTSSCRVSATSRPFWAECGSRLHTFSTRPCSHKSERQAANSK